jgi:hypothetical protein
MIGAPYFSRSAAPGRAKVLFDSVENVRHSMSPLSRSAPWPSLRVVDVRNPRDRLTNSGRNIAADPGDGKPSPGYFLGPFAALDRLERFLLMDRLDRLEG